MFFPHISRNAKYFSFLFQDIVINVIVYYFPIWNKKDRKIIKSRIISSHMGTMYIETPNTSEIYDCWNIFLGLLISFLQKISNKALKVYTVKDASSGI